jgi:hypothetical protein
MGKESGPDRAILRGVAMQRVNWAVVVLAGVLCGASAAAGQTAAPTTEDCQACHSEPTLTRADNSPVFVEPQGFAQSVHQILSCVDCHTDLAAAELPHPEQLAPVNCATCHEEPATEFAKSVHAAIPANRGGAATCADCHGPPHRIRPAAEPDSPTNHLQVVNTCGRCHGNTADAARRGPPVAPMFADSIHGQALTRTGLVVAPTCSDCHESHGVVTTRNPESPVFARNVPATCGRCHAGIHRDYADSVHATELQAGAPNAPHCASCHSAHQVAPTQGPEWQLAAVEQCGTCHREALATFRDTFHGQVTGLGFEPVAQCADCHSSHRVFRVSDARSTVSAENRLKTCQTCHPAATPNFARYEPHANKHEQERFPALYYAARFMNGLLIGVFAFFGIHTALWFLRERTGRQDDDHTGR